MLLGGTHHEHYDCLILTTRQVDSGSLTSPLVESLVTAMLRSGAVRTHLRELAVGAAAHTAAHARCRMRRFMCDGRACSSGVLWIRVVWRV